MRGCTAAYNWKLIIKQASYGGGSGDWESWRTGADLFAEPVIANVKDLGPRWSIPVSMAVPTDNNQLVDI